MSQQTYIPPLESYRDAPLPDVPQGSLPLTKEEQAEFRARVHKIAETMGMKSSPHVIFSDGVQINAAYHGAHSFNSVEDDLVVNIPMIRRLTPREQNAIIAHELGHRETFRNGKYRQLREGTAMESTADEIAVKKWGDPEGFISALQKADAQTFTDREVVQLAHDYGARGRLRQYDRADDEGKRKILEESKNYLHKIAEEDSVKYPPLEERIANIRSYATEETPQLKARAEWMRTLDQMENAAKSLTQDAAPEVVQEKLKEIMTLSGRKDAVPPAVSGADAEALGKKLLDEIQQVRDEQQGHMIDKVGNVILSQNSPQGKGASAAKHLDQVLASADLNGLRMLSGMQHDPQELPTPAGGAKTQRTGPFVS